MAEQLTLNQRVRGSSPLRLTWEELTVFSQGAAMFQERRIATPVDWLFAPELIENWASGSFKKPGRWRCTGMTEAAGGSA